MHVCLEVEAGLHKNQSVLVYHLLRPTGYTEPAVCGRGLEAKRLLDMQHGVKSNVPGGTQESQREEAAGQVGECTYACTHAPNHTEVLRPSYQASRQQQQKRAAAQYGMHLVYGTVYLAEGSDSTTPFRTADVVRRVPESVPSFAPPLVLKRPTTHAMQRKSKQAENNKVKIAGLAG